MDRTADGMGVDKPSVAQPKSRSFRLRPTNGKIVVQEENFHYGGKIIVPETAQRRPTVGTVLEVGYGVGYWEESENMSIDPATGLPDRRFVPLVKSGDKVVYGLYSGTVINFKGQPAFRILREDEILAVLEGTAEFEGAGV